MWKARRQLSGTRISTVAGVKLPGHDVARSWCYFLFYELFVAYILRALVYMYTYDIRYHMKVYMSYCIVILQYIIAAVLHDSVVFYMLYLKFDDLLGQLYRRAHAAATESFELDGSNFKALEEAIDLGPSRRSSGAL